jgi:hypothetical protein
VKNWSPFQDVCIQQYRLICRLRHTEVIRIITAQRKTTLSKFSFVQPANQSRDHSRHFVQI